MIVVEIKLTDDNGLITSHTISTLDLTYGYEIEELFNRLRDSTVKVFDPYYHE